MKHETHNTRQGINGLWLMLALLLCGALSGATAAQPVPSADESGPRQEQEAKKESDARKSGDAKEQKAAKSERPDRSASVRTPAGERDPFNKYRVVIRKRVTNVPVPVDPPSIQARIERYKEQKRIAMNLQQPAPKPTTALLLSEMQVVGIFRTPRGYAAMVEATPIKLSYTIYPGEKFFDGQLVAIEEDRLVFRHETRWTDGHLARAVETKPLRQANIVADPLAAVTKEQPKESGGNGSSASSPQSGKGEEKTASPEKQ